MARIDRTSLESDGQVATIMTDDGWKVRVVIGNYGRISVVTGREDHEDFMYEQFTSYHDGDLSLSMIPPTPTKES